MVGVSRETLAGPAAAGGFMGSPSDPPTKGGSGRFIPFPPGGVLSTVLRYTSFPFAYFLTFTCHGAHLHDHPSGSVDRLHNQSGSRFPGPNRELHASMVRQMGIDPYSLSWPRRQCVLKAILDACLLRRWPPVDGSCPKNSRTCGDQRRQGRSHRKAGCQDLCHAGAPPPRLRSIPATQVDAQRKCSSLVEPGQT